VLATRDVKGRLCAFVNVCRHKGAMLCAAEEGNAKYHVCPYHGWAYDGIGGRTSTSRTARPGAIHPRSRRGPQPRAPRAGGELQGFVFGSLSDEVPPLENFLGDMRFFIDVVADQGPRGLEFHPRALGVHLSRQLEVASSTTVSIPIT